MIDGKIYIEKKYDHMVFINLEKAYEKVTNKILWKVGGILAWGDIFLVLYTIFSSFLGSCIAGVSMSFTQFCEIIEELHIPMDKNILFRKLYIWSIHVLYTNSIPHSYGYVYPCTSPGTSQEDSNLT